MPKATFSYAMAVMDKVEGWKEEEWVGSYLAASMWMHLQPILAIIIESVSWVNEDFLWDHEWITETKRLP